MRLVLAAALLCAACFRDPAGPCEPAAGAARLERPAFHFATPRGWLNDPAGLVFFEGEYHLFFQHNPDADIWGAMSWGHAVSADLVSWEVLPIVFEPDPVLGDAYTGSAVVAPASAGGVCGEGGPCLVAMYTRAGGADGRQKQVVAVSHDRGRTFVPAGDGPVLQSPGPADFRDPKVLWHAPSGRWVAVVGTRDGVLLYASTDLLSWSALGEFKGENVPSGVWECPDLFPLAAPDGSTAWVLKADVVPGALQTGEARYWVGTFDGTTFTVTTHAEGRRIDGATDFYAAQSWFGLSDGRRVWVAWLDDWGYAMSTPSPGWRGVLTVPRELSLVQAGSGLALSQRPVPELAAAFETCTRARVEDVPVVERLPLMESAPDALLVDVTLAVGDATEVGLSLLKGDGEETKIGYDAATGTLFLDRTHSGHVSSGPSFPKRYTRPVALEAGQLQFRVLLDWQSVELFSIDGTAVLSAQVFPGNPVRAIEAYATGSGAQVVAFEAHGLSP